MEDLVFGEDKFNRCELFISNSLQPRQIMLASNSGCRYRTLNSDILNLTELHKAVEQMKLEIPHSDHDEKYWDLYLTGTYVEQYRKLRENRKQTYCLLVA